MTDVNKPTFSVKRIEGETYGVYFNGVVIGKHAKDVAEAIAAATNVYDFGLRDKLVKVEQERQDMIWERDDLLRQIIALRTTHLATVEGINNSLTTCIKLASEARGKGDLEYARQNEFAVFILRGIVKQALLGGPPTPLADVQAREVAIMIIRHRIGEDFLAGMSKAQQDAMIEERIPQWIKLATLLVAKRVTV